MNTCIEITKCEVCDSHDLSQVLNLGDHPMCDDLIPIGNPEHCKSYKIEILYCKKCDTAHQKYQVPKNQLFPQSYHYRSRFTADVLSGMSELVKSVEMQLGSLAGRVVVDVGCNDGSLLDKFSAQGAKTIGVEPTDAYTDAMGREHIIVNEFFSKSTAMKILQNHRSIDVITFTNVFAHIENLPDLLSALSLLMNENTLLVIENHYLGAVLDRYQFDTFYHEHPRTYSLNSFLNIAHSLRRDIVMVDFPKRYGGNIRVMIGKTGSRSQEANQRIMSTLEKELEFCNNFISMESFIENWRKNKKVEIRSLIEKHGKLVAKAFPGRAAILVKLLELTANEIECVYEKPGSLKIGNYLPGTRIPIKSDEGLFLRLSSLEVILNFAWHIPKEIEQYLRGHGYAGEIVNLL